MNKYRYLLLFVLGFSVLFGGCGKSEGDYKKASVAINIEEFSRKPDSFKDKPIMFTGSVSNVKENGKESDMLFILGKTPMLVHYKLKDNEERIVAHDTIRVWGDYQKVSSQKFSELTAETSVIEVEAKYIYRPKWNFLVGMFTQNGWTSSEDGIPNPMDNKSLLLSLSVKKINPDNVEVTGQLRKERAYFDFKGIINDDGIGEFEYLDKQQKAGNGIKGKIKIKTKNEIEFETAKIEQEVSPGWLSFGQNNKGTTVTLEPGTYLLKSK